MKKRKILYLFPLAALVLSGCTFQEGWEITKNWTNEKVFTPVVDFFKGIFGIEDKKEEKKDDEKPTPSPEGEGEGQGGEGEGGGGGQQGGGAIDTYGTEHEGTENDPLTGADAMTIVAQLGEDEIPEESFYIRDEVEELMEDFNPTYGNFTFKLAGGFLCYRLKFGPNGQKFTSASDLEVGDTVTVYAQVQNYHGDTPETKGGYVVKVEKPVIDAELVRLDITGTPVTSYLAGQAYTYEGLRLIATYDNDETQDVTVQATWEIDKAVAELGDTVIAITASFGDMSTCITVDVTVKDASHTEHAGTAEDPYSGSDACIIASGLENKTPTADSYYIRGVVESFEETFNPDYGNFSFKIDGGFIGWRLKGPDGAKFTSASDLEVGDTVTMYAKIQNYDGKPETSGGNITEIVKPAVAVEQVVLTDESLSLEVGQQTALGASVLPAKASQEVTWEIGQTTQVVSFENGMVLALAEGEAIITATSVADPTVSASCEVTVTEATKELLSIAITGTPKTEYNEGDEYTAEGLKVMAHYNVGEDEDVTANATIELSKAKAELGDTSFTVTASYGTAQPAELVVNVTVAEVNQFAEAYAAALAISSGETAEFTFKGVIVAKRQNNEWFIQHDGMGIEYYANNENFAVGKLVKVTSTLQNYKGLPETKTIKSSEVLGDGTMPTPVELASGADVAAAKLNVLANVTGTAKADWSSYSASANNTLTLVGSDGQDIAVYFKSGLFSAKEDALKAVKEGDTVAFTNVVTSKFNNPQILFAAGSDLTVTPAPAKEIASITSVTGPTEVAINGTVSTNDVTVVVEYTDGSSGNATVTAVTVDTSSAGQKTADVTIEGWNETLHFDITVSSGIVLTEQEVYKLDGTITGGSSGYAEASDITQGGVHWDVVGNTTMNPWRIGGKNLSGVDRNVNSKAAVTSDNLTKVEVKTGTKTLSAINSITIKVGSTKGGDDLGTKAFTTNLVSATLEFARPEGKDWSNAYITVVFNVNAASSNQYIQLLAVSLYAMK